MQSKLDGMQMYYDELALVLECWDWEEPGDLSLVGWALERTLATSQLDLAKLATMLEYVVTEDPWTSADRLVLKSAFGRHGIRLNFNK